MRIARALPGRPTASLLAVGALLAASAGLTACASSSSSRGDGPLAVVAAENFWGSIAQQIGGQHVEVTSIIDSPDADPHDYEPDARDGRAVATADLVLVNGLGYDQWATNLVEANPSPDRALVTVAEVAGHEESEGHDHADGENPHLWYDPAVVKDVITAVTDEYKRLDPANAADYDASADAFRKAGLADYDAAIESIRKDFDGTKVGASESVFAPLAAALDLDLVTPSKLLNAVSEGVDPTAADKRTADQQIESGEIAVFVYNAQNATPDVQSQVDAARKKGIPVTTVTETLTPAGSTFQAWQTRQLEALKAALQEADGR